MDAGHLLIFPDREWAVPVVTPPPQPYAAELAGRARDLGGWYDPHAQS